MQTLNRTELVENLRRLDHRHQIAFAASCCERLLPNYTAFAVTEQWGEPALLRTTLDRIWKFVEGEAMPHDTGDLLLSQCMEGLPDSEDFQSIFTGLAQDAAASLMHTLESCVELNTDDLAQVAELALDSVDAYLNAACDPYPGTHGANKALDEWIEQAPMFEAELHQQQEDLESIASWTGNNVDLARSLQQSSRTVGIQPFSRGIVMDRAS